VVTLILLVAVTAIGLLVISSGVVTPRYPGEATLDWGNRLLGVDGGPDDARPRRHASGRRGHRRTYRVMSGDTLARVSRRTGLSVRDLRGLNPGLDPLNLQRGRVLRLRD
jgi:hypothetical protein